MAYDDEDYFLPLEDQRVFGAGIKRKRVPFVPSSSETDLQTTKSAPATTSTTPAPGSSIGDKYLSIVLSSRSTEPSDPAAETEREPEPPPADDTQTCDICHLPLSSRNGDTNTRPHESSIAHQVCLDHSQPPSAIDRRRAGYKYLSSYGWDPDARKGLGPTGHGIQVPIKTKVKNDTVGLGISVPEGAADRLKKKPDAKLNAKQTRNMELDKRKQSERLGDLFYRSEDVQKYLGE